MERWTRRWHKVVLALLSGAVASGLSVGAAAAASTSAPSSLGPGQALAPRSLLSSRNGQYTLRMQRDGNLVEYRRDAVLWATGTGGNPGASLRMQENGDLVVYGPAGGPLWSSGTDKSGDAGASLFLQDDGNLVIYSGPGHKALWTNYHPLPRLALGDDGPAVAELQRRLWQLHYWVGPANGVFGDSTQQAMFALDKAAGLERTGILGPAARQALAEGVEPKIRPASGDLVEVNLASDLLMIIRQGELYATLNTSTGGGYTYTSQGVTSVAITPQGVFHVYRQIDGPDVDALGELWRPKFFTGGYAIHGDSYVPAYPVSHGCVRVSDEAIDWIWANDVITLGEEVWVY